VVGVLQDRAVDGELGRVATACDELVGARSGADPATVDAPVLLALVELELVDDARDGDLLVVLGLPLHLREIAQASLAATDLLLRREDMRYRDDGELGLRGPPAPAALPAAGLCLWLLGRRVAFALRPAPALRR